MNQNIPFDTVTSIIDARRGGSSIDEITRVFAIDRDTAFSVIRRVKTKTYATGGRTEDRSMNNKKFNPDDYTKDELQRLANIGLKADIERALARLPEGYLDPK